MKKILTISIAAYNVEGYLDRCLNSIIDCKHREKVDVIVVNDGSTDKTKEVCQKYVDKYPNIINLFNKENGGHGSTINTSIKNARGIYFKTLDADDYVDSTNLDKLILFLERAKDDLIMNPYFIVDIITNQKKEQTVFGKYSGKRMLSVDINEISSEIDIAMHSMTFKTAILKEIGPVIDEKCFYVDTEYTLYPLPKIKTITLLEYPIYNYVLGIQNQSMNINSLIKRRKEHFTVIVSLIRFYETIKLDKKVNKEILTLVKKRISNVVFFHYYILLRSKEKSSKNEWLEFDIWLKKGSLDIYTGCIIASNERSSRYILVIKILRKLPILYPTIRKYLIFILL